MPSGLISRGCSSRGLALISSIIRRLDISTTTHIMYSMFFRPGTGRLNPCGTRMNTFDASHPFRLKGLGMIDGLLGQLYQSEFIESFSHFTDRFATQLRLRCKNNVTSNTTGSSNIASIHMAPILLDIRHFALNLRPKGRC